MSGPGISGWVALGLSTALGVCCGAFIFGYLLGRGEWLGAGIIAGASVWLVSTVVGAVRAAELPR